MWILGGIIVLALVGATGYNSLVRRRNVVDQAYSTIEVQLVQRYDLIPKLVETVKQYMGHERSLLEDIVRLRALHVEMDQAVAAAYGWSDLNLGHGFHETKQGVRYTLSDSARRAVLDRLLSLNHQRHEQEVEAGLHDKKSKGSGKRASSKSKLERGTAQGRLY